jgi:O-antigen/teichoic acid export membrane protein
VCIFQNELLLVLGRPEYACATSILDVIVLAYFFRNASNLMDAGFYVRRRTQLKPVIAFVAAVVITFLYAWLIPLYKVQGAAYATLGGFVAFGCCNLPGLPARFSG